MFILSRGGAQYQTKAMDHEQAHRFAACLRANGRFEGVMLYEERNPRNPLKTHRVVYHPKSGDRIAELVEKAGESRQARAETEGQAYLFLKDGTDARPFWWVFNPKSGNTYEVCDVDCGCPDREFRGRAAHVPCVHMRALRAGIGTYITREP